MCLLVIRLILCCKVPTEKTIRSLAFSIRICLIYDEFNERSVILSTYASCYPWSARILKYIFILLVVSKFTLESKFYISYTVWICE